ncbi:MAG TPA: ABC transporter ATP-binding protein [Acidimicrobiales bacterium]|nr:ABC transporter ATP-binding protein [Acidimicrobiales bacterium]
MLALEVSGLTTGYVRAPVLRDVSFTLGDEILGVLGANGAGKTTLLRALSGNLKSWSGSISLRGDLLGRATPWIRARRGLAHVPEGRHVFGALSVEDNLDVAALTGRERAFTKQRVFELFPRLLERRSQLAGSLSGGEQQMLVIGRALLTGPSVLLVDELSAGLAPVTARELVESLAAIHREGVAMILVEQSPRLIADVVDRVIVLEHGGIGAEGTIDEIGGADGLADRYLATR